MMATVSSTKRRPEDQEARLVKLSRKLAFSVQSVVREGRGEATEDMEREAMAESMLPSLRTQVAALAGGESSAAAPCPKVRFGRTELQVSIVTCGGMRLQQSWNRGGRVVRWVRHSGEGEGRRGGGICCVVRGSGKGGFGGTDGDDHELRCVEGEVLDKDS